MEKVDLDRAGALAGRIGDEVSIAMSVLNLYLGYRMELFRAMEEIGPCTPEQLAGATGMSERYLREWLECMASGEYIEHDPASGRFALTPEQRAVYLVPDHPAHALPNVAFIPSLASVLPRLMHAFRHGTGVPFEDYGDDLVDAQGAAYRPIFENDLVASWLAAMPDIEARLRRGGRVADVGCGVGWSAIAIARAFPEVRIDAIEPDGRSIDSARRNVAEAGLADRIRFHQAGIEDAGVVGPFDLVTLFECLHDMAYPVDALRAMRELLAPDGAALISDEKVAESLAENTGPLGRLYYNFSVLHCLPQSMAHPGSAATGAVIRPSTVRRYAADAGFTRVEILPVDHPLFHLYRLGA
jgi:2-polyprenyl-3-methyl-5-hydroxy-6-metoxy-1,4-benzoquinol methylase